MSQSTDTGHLDQLGWDQIDRLNKALRVSGLTVARLANALGVHRNTIGNYLSGRTQADKRTLMAWALATGVPYEWVTTGQVTSSGPNDGGGSGATNVLQSYGRGWLTGITPSDFDPAANEPAHMVAAA